MSQKIKDIAKVLTVVFLIATALYFWVEKADNFFSDKDDFAGLPCYEKGDIGYIEVKGHIVTYLAQNPDSEDRDDDAVSSEDVVYCLDKMQHSDVMGVIFEIDSAGGSPVASEEIMTTVKRFSRPSVALIRESGTSGAYLIASATNHIFASELSDVGGIGVSGSYLDYSEKNKKDGVIYQQISAGKFKDTGDSDKPLTEEERELMMRDIKILHEAFIKNVSVNRKLDAEKVRKLADGSSMLGRMAKENGLIDEIGGREEAENWIRAMP